MEAAEILMGLSVLKGKIIAIGNPYITQEDLNFLDEGINKVQAEITTKVVNIDV